MSIMMNNVAPSPMAVNSANGGSASHNSSSEVKSENSEFSSLIAKLLGLDAPNQNAQPVSDELAQNANNSALVAQGLANGLEASKTPQNQTAISDLMQAVEKIEASLANGKPIDKETIQEANAAITALINKLEVIAPTSMGDITSTFGAQLQIQGANNANASISEMAKSISAQSQPFQQALQALTSKEASSKLNNLAQEIAKPTQGSSNNGATAELVQNLQQLGQKLGDIAPINMAMKNANPTVPNMNANGSKNEETAKSLAALLGSKNNANGVASDASATKLDQSAIAYIKGQKPSSLSANNNNNFAQEASTSAKIITNGVSAPTAMAAASLTSATPITNNVNLNIQADPSLMSLTMVSANAGSDLASTLKPSTALYQGPQQNLNLPHVAFEFAKNLQAGLSRFQIRLDPPEMGRIDVKMEIDKSGSLNAKLTVERAETLDLLQRDVRALERALAQAGLDSNKTNLEFSLKQNPFANHDNQFAQGEKGFGEDLFDDEEQNDSDIISAIPSTIIYHGTASPGGLNITA